jgi:hypothetical protein
MLVRLYPQPIPQMHQGLENGRTLSQTGRLVQLSQCPSRVDGSKLLGTILNHQMTTMHLWNSARLAKAHHRLTASVQAFEV